MIGDHIFAEENIYWSINSKQETLVPNIFSFELKKEHNFRVPLIRAFYSAPRGEGDADFKICGPATQKNYGNATAAPPEPGRNFGPAFGGAQYSKQNKNKL